MIILNEELSIKKISEIIQYFQTNELPRLVKLEKYYLGKHDILSRKMVDNTKPNNRVVINYPSYICDSYSSYLVGTPISYDADESIKGILEYNDVADIDFETATDANIFGYGINELYVDENGDIRFTKVSPLNTILLYDNSIEHNIVAAIKFYNIGGYKFNVEVWDKERCVVFSATDAFSDLNYLYENLHYFKDVPFVEFINNEYRQSSFEPVMSLIDGLEKLSSDEVNTFEAFCDCYMILKNVTADSGDLATMKENRVLLLPSDADASYLTKDVNTQQIQNLKEDFIENIHKISAVPNMSDSNFAANASGVAIRYKLLAFENNTAKKERKYKKGLQRRFELINNILSITSKAYLGIKITFTRNLPINEVEIAQEINTLRGLVSTKTLISQLPFVEDVDEEIKLLDEEKETSVSLYSFGSEEA